MAEPTQMITVSIPTSCNLEDTSTEEGKIWHEILLILHQAPHYKRMYWGRRVEKPENVQLHIVRGLLQHHYDFLSSLPYVEFVSLLSKLTPNPPIIHHALLSEFSSGCSSLGKGAPVTGTAIYLSCTGAWDIAWAEWVQIIQHIPGFMGIAGGPVMESVNGNERCFVALVGWENVEIHESYHHTEHFRERRRILLDPAGGGYIGYGHIAFGQSTVGNETGKSML